MHLQWYYLYDSSFKCTLICDLKEVVMIAVWCLFCKTIPIPAPTECFTGSTPSLLPTFPLMAFHFLWGRNEYLIVSMARNTSNWKRHSMSRFGYRVAGRWAAKHRPLFINTFYTQIMPFQSSCTTPGEISNSATTQPIDSRPVIKIIHFWSGTILCSSFSWRGTPCHSSHLWCTPYGSKNQQNCSSENTRAGRR